MSIESLKIVFDLEKEIATLTARLEAAKAKLAPALRVRLFGAASRDSDAKVAVEAIDPRTGLVVHTFESGRAAEAFGFTASSISTCLNGKGRSHRGFFWRRLGDTTMPEIESPADRTNYVDRFCAEFLREAPGHLMPFGDFYDRFTDWLPNDERTKWSQVRASRALPDKFQSATGNQNKTYIVNASWDQVEPLAPYVVIDGRLKRSEPFRHPGRQGVAIEAVDPNTGDVVHTFPSTTAAAKSGFTKAGISNTINGRQQMYRGLVWRRAS